MTKVYNDTEALTHLLEEKERDLELAARIGQTLLDENKLQCDRIEELELELFSANERIVQLNHNISTKEHLLELYLRNEENNDNDEEQEETSLQDYSLVSLNSSAQLVIELEKRVGSLEDENLRLKSERNDRSKEIENEEKKELELISECGRNLKRTHQKLIQLQEDYQKKVEENQHLAKDVKFFKNKSKVLEQQTRILSARNEALERALSLSNECQSELTLELIDIKEQHTKLLAAFHDKQKECRELLQKSAMNDPYFSYVQSLAYELEQPNDADEAMINYDCDSYKINNNLNQFGIHDSGFIQCPTPDSLLSADSAFPNSPCPSFVPASSDRTKTGATTVSDSQAPQNITKTVHSKSLSVCSNSGSTIITAPITSNGSINPTSSSSSGAGTTTLVSQTSQTPSSSVKNHFLTDKLRYIKPLEGSQILNRWRMLASPTPSALFEDKENCISRIKANLAATEVKIEQQCRENADDVTNEHYNSLTKETDTSDLAAYVNNFGGTSSVFTFTTTSLSQSINSSTNVTSTFSNVQPSIGKSVYKDLTFTCAQAASENVNNGLLLNDFKNSAFVCALQGSSESRTIQNKTPMIYSSKAVPNQARASVTTTQSAFRHALPHVKGSFFSKMDPVGGLNELTKILERDRVMKQSTARLPPKQNLFASSLIGTNLLNPNRIMTKAMVNANSELLSLTSIPTMEFSRTDVSALRNLRKGGLI